MSSDVKVMYISDSVFAAIQRLYAAAKKAPKPCERAVRWLTELRTIYEPAGSMLNVLDLIQARPFLNERDMENIERLVESQQQRDVVLLKICDIARDKWLKPT